mmetsp:Transcript_24589/g.82534  ORF Transcript_24589/g.82534 Transcript_24589/m.82534 type:complete len:590 (-) Transcript_24589:106-1875(-)
MGVTETAGGARDPAVVSSGDVVLTTTRGMDGAELPDGTGPVLVDAATQFHDAPAPSAADPPAGAAPGHDGSRSGSESGASMVSARDLEPLPPKPPTTGPKVYSVALASLVCGSCSVMMQAVLIAAASSLLSGYDQGVIASAMLTMREDLGLSGVQEELAIGVVNISAAIGAIGAGALADRYGRKRAIACAHALFFLGSIIITGALGFWALFLGRILQGFGVGTALVVPPILKAELVPPEQRDGLVRRVHQPRHPRWVRDRARLPRRRRRVALDVRRRLRAAHVHPRATLRCAGVPPVALRPEQGGARAARARAAHRLGGVGVAPGGGHGARQDGRRRAAALVPGALPAGPRGARHGLAGLRHRLLLPGHGHGGGHLLRGGGHAGGWCADHAQCAPGHHGRGGLQARLPAHRLALLRPRGAAPHAPALRRLPLRLALPPRGRRVLGPARPLACGPWPVRLHGLLLRGLLPARVRVLLGTLPVLRACSGDEHRALHHAHRGRDHLLLLCLPPRGTHPCGGLALLRAHRPRGLRLCLLLHPGDQGPEPGEHVQPLRPPRRARRQAPQAPAVLPALGGQHGDAQHAASGRARP